MVNRKMDIFHMTTAWILAQNSSCCSKKVGAILVNDNRILSSGYNGTRKGVKNCGDHAKEMGWSINGINLSSENRSFHREWSMKNEYHAEQNALDNASRLGIPIKDCSLFVTISPCIECCKRISNVGINRLVYSEEYDFSDNEWKKFLEDSGVLVERITLKELGNAQDFLNVENLKYDMVVRW